MNGISKSILAPTMEVLKEKVNSPVLTVQEYAENQQGIEYWYQSVYGRKRVRIVGYETASMAEPYDSGRHFAIEIPLPHSSFIRTKTERLFTKMIEVSIEELTPVEG